MATVLLVGGGLLMRSFVKLAGVNLGFEPEHLLTFQVSLRGDKHPTAELKTFADELVGRLRSVPGVEAASYARQLPMVQLEDHFVFRTTPGPGSLSDFSPDFAADARFVSRDYLRAFGIRVIEGRGLDAADADGNRRALVVNRSLARRYFPDESPIGKIAYAGVSSAPWQIVGVVDDQRQLGLDREPTPGFYADIGQWAGRNMFPVGPYYAVRTRNNPESIIALVRGVVRQLDDEAPLYNVVTMEQIVSNAITLPRMYAILLAIFAAIAAGLAAVGIYGVVAYLGDAADAGNRRPNGARRPPRAGDRPRAPPGHRMDVRRHRHRSRGCRRRHPLSEQLAVRTAAARSPDLRYCISRLRGRRDRCSVRARPTRRDGRPFDRAAFGIDQVDHERMHRALIVRPCRASRTERRRDPFYQRRLCDSCMRRAGPDTGCGSEPFLILAGPHPRSITPSRRGARRI